MTSSFVSQHESRLTSDADVTDEVSSKVLDSVWTLRVRDVTGWAAGARSSGACTAACVVTSKLFPDFDPVSLTSLRNDDAARLFEFGTELSDVSCDARDRECRLSGRVTSYM